MAYPVHQPLYTIQCRQLKSVNCKQLNKKTKRFTVSCKSRTTFMTTTELTNLLSEVSIGLNNKEKCWIKHSTALQCHWIKACIYGGKAQQFGWVTFIMKIMPQNLSWGSLTFTNITIHAPKSVQKCGFRVRTEIWLWFARLLQDKITSFSRLFVHLYVNNNITKLAFKCWSFLYNVFFYSIYRMWLIFLTLNFRCFVLWIARKWTNSWVINSVIDICIFQVSTTVFKHFSKLFHTYDHFQGFSKPWKSLH